MSSIPRAAASSNQYVVQGGDTLSAIAKSHGVFLSALEAANPQIQNPNLIFPGEHVNIPSSAVSGQQSGNKTYTVQQGDTLSAIGERFGVDWHVLAQANHLANPNLIFPGEKLQISGSGTSASGGAGASQGSSGAKTYIVQQGDTLSAIGERFGVDWHVLAQTNDLANPNLIFPGEKLQISGAPTSGSGSAGPSQGTSGSSGPSPTNGTTPASLQGRINQAMQFFEGQGWTRAQAAGIVANLQAESGLNPGIQQFGGGPGYGLAQWEGPRQASFAQWAGHDIHGSSFSEQLQFVQFELTHTESGAGNALHGAQNAADAGAIVCRLYERPADIAGQSQVRAGLAQQIFASSAGVGA